MKRLFAAIKITPSEEFLDILEALKFDLFEDQIKWVDENKMHLTLKFFGDTEEEKITPICEILENAAKATGQFEINLQNTGIFGSQYEPRVIWLGIEPSEELQSLYFNITENLRKIGYIPDRQNFVPHLTIGRIKQITDKKFFQKAINRHKEKFIQTEWVDEFYLIESILKREGPDYQLIETFELGM